MESELTLQEKLENVCKNVKSDVPNTFPNYELAESFVKNCLAPEKISADLGKMFIREDVATAFGFEGSDGLRIIEKLIKVYQNALYKIKKQAEKSGNDQDSTEPRAAFVTFGTKADIAAKSMQILTDEFIDTYTPTFSLGGALYTYENGIYKTGETTTTAARNYIVELANRHGISISPSNTDNVLRKVCDCCAITMADICNAPERLVVKNGILDVVTGDLQYHTPSELHITGIPIEYNPMVEISEEFKAYLNSTFEGVEWEIPIFQEVIGHCLYREYVVEKCALFIGDGGNGKSVAMNVMEGLLGHHNISALKIHDICKPQDKHILIGLRGKLANLCGETGTDEIDNFGNMKLITGKDEIETRDLYKSWTHFRNYAKCVFSMNKPPTINDGTHGKSRRLQIIDFPNTFEEGKNAIQNLEEKLIEPESLTGILNWALEGLRRLLENGKFSDPRSMAIINIQYERKSNPIHAFFNECIDECTKYGDQTKDEAEFNLSRLTYEEIFEAYSNYAKTEKLPSLKQNEIIDQLIIECNRAGWYVKKARDQYAPGKPRSSYLKGIKLCNVEYSDGFCESVTSAHGQCRIPIATL